MASITRRAGETRWQARFRDSSGREYAKRFSRKTDAQRWVDEQTAALLVGQFVDPRAGRITVKHYAKDWEAQQVGRPATARIVDNALRLHLLPRLGSRPLSAIMRSDVQAMVADLSTRLAAGSVRNVYDVTARLFASAVEDRLISSSPCRRIALPQDGQGEVRAPTTEDVLALADAVPGRYRPLIILLAGSGLRIGEALGLKRSDVDFLRRTVRVERQRLQDGSVAATKTARSVRTVPVAQTVLDALTPILAGLGADDWLWTTEAGEPLGYRRWKIEWSAALAESGLTWTTHDLRHFTASALIAGGASVKQVQAVLGHSSAVITLRTYAHLWPGDDDRTRSVMEDALWVLRTNCGQGTAPDRIVAGQGQSEDA